MLKFRSSKHNILVDVYLSRPIPKDNVVSVLPDIPNSKRKNDLPRGLIPQLMGLVFKVFLHPMLKVALVKATVGVYAQTVPDIVKERTVSKPMENHFKLSFTQWTYINFIEASLNKTLSNSRAMVHALPHECSYPRQSFYFPNPSAKELTITILAINGHGISKFEVEVSFVITFPN